MCEEEEIIKEENPQLPAAFGFVKTSAVEQLARPQAISERVEDQILKEKGGGNTARFRGNGAKYSI